MRSASGPSPRNGNTKRDTMATNRRFRFLHLLRRERIPRISLFRRPISGWVDGLSQDHIRGWAFDRSRPGLRLTVRAISESGHTVQVLADRYRADVHKSGYGDGHYGFAVPISLLGRFESTRFVCEPSGVKLHAANTVLPLVFRRGTFILHLDQPIPGARLTGWAMDRADLNRRCRLKVFAAGREIANLRATLFRPEAVAQGGDGLCGFSVQVPPESRNLIIVDLHTHCSIRI